MCVLVQNFSKSSSWIENVNYEGIDNLFLYHLRALLIVEIRS